LFLYFRASLTSVHHRDPVQAVEIARFREANAALETRLRTKLPDRMAEIDFLYGGAFATPQQRPA
jgi:hypothetical protein